MSHSGHDGMLPRSPIFVRPNYPNLTLGWEPCPQETVRTRRNPSATGINPLTHHDLSVMMGRVGDEPAGNEPAPLIRPLNRAGDEPVASVFKPQGSRKYRIQYFDENGRRRKATGCTDKAESERI